MEPAEQPFGSELNFSRVEAAFKELSNRTQLPISRLTGGSYHDEDYDDDDQDPIGFDSEFGLHLPEVDDGVLVTYGYFLSLMEELSDEQVQDDNFTLYTGRRFMKRVEAVDDLQSYALQELPEEAFQPQQSKVLKDFHNMMHEEGSWRYHLDGYKDSEAKQRYPRLAEEVHQIKLELGPQKRLFALEQTWENRTLRCSLVVGFSHLAVSTALQGNWMKDYPAYFTDDLAVEIEWTDGLLDRAEATAATEAYLYSLETSIGLRLKPGPRPPSDDIDQFGHEAISAPLQGRIRPLRSGIGLSDLHSLYLRASATTDVEIQHLFFTKVLEYVSQTVVRLERNESARRLLMLDGTLEAGADYVERLAELFAEHQQRARDDLRALKQTLLRCCNAEQLAPLAPKFLRIASVSSKSSRQNKEHALQSLADAVYSTRNQIAHAKANCSLTGHECPTEALPDLVACTRVAAQAAILWYGDLPSAIRLHAVSD